MPDLTIAQLTAANALSGTELVPISQNGATRRTSVNAFASFTANPNLPVVYPTGSDDTTIMQAAAANGPFQLVPNAVYTTGEVNFTTPYTFVQGNGATWTRKNATGGNRMITLKAAHIGFYDIIFAGNKSNQSTSLVWIGVDGSAGRNYYTFKGNTFQDSLDYITINLTGSQYVWGDSNRFFIQGSNVSDGANGSGFYGIADGTKNWWITNNYAEIGHPNNFTGCKFVQVYSTSSASPGASGNINVTGNEVNAVYAVGGSATLDNTTDTFTLGFSIAAGQIITGTQVTIHSFATFPTNGDGVLNDNICYAILVNAGAGTIKLAKTLALANANSPINWTSNGSQVYLYTPQGNMAIEAFYLTNCNFADNNIINCHYGISGSASDSSYTGNVIENSRFYSIELGGGINGTVISGNSVVDGGHGIYMSGWCKNIKISGNTVDLSAPSVPFGTGIYFAGDGHEISGNTIVNPYDIAINGPFQNANCTVSDNTIIIGADKPLNGASAPQAINLTGKFCAANNNKCYISSDGTNNTPGVISLNGHKLSCKGNTIIGAAGAGAGTGNSLARIDCPGISVGSGSKCTESVIEGNFISGFVVGIKTTNSGDNSGTILRNNDLVGFPGNTDYALRGDEMWEWSRHFSASASPTNVGYYRKGDLINNTSAAAGQPSGWVCTQSGYSGTMTSVATTINGSNIVEITSLSATIVEGVRINIAGAIAAGFVTALIGKEASYTGNLTSVSTSTNILTLSVFVPPTGTPIKFAGGSLPSGITAGTIYYWRRLSQTTGTIHTTSALSYSGATAVSVGTTGSGTYASAIILVSSVAATAPVAGVTIAANTAATFSAMANL